MNDTTGRRPERGNNMKKNYQVFYWIKKDRKEYLNHMYILANNSKEACKICKEQVKLQTGRNAFRPTTKAPDPT